MQDLPTTFNRIILLAVAYYVTARVGLMFPVVGEEVTLFWIPSGLSLAATLLYGPRVAVGMFIGAFFSFLASGWGIALILAAGDTLGTLLAYAMLRRLAFNPDLSGNSDALKLLSVGIISGFLTSVNVVAGLELFGRIGATAALPTLLYNWMGATLGVIMFTSQVLAWQRHKRFVWNALRRSEALLHLILLLLLSALIFSDLSREVFGIPFHPFLLLTLIIWSALRFNMRHTMMSSSLVFLFSMIGMAFDQGVFSPISKESLTELWLYNLVMGVTALFLSILNYQRGQAVSLLASSETNLKRAQAVAKIGSWTFDVRADRLACSEEAVRIYGGRPELILQRQGLLDRIYLDDVQWVAETWAAALRGAPYDIEYRLLLDGQLKWVRETAQFDRSAIGVVTQVVGVVQDISERKRLESQQLLAAKVFECSNDAILITDERGAIQAVNQAFTTLTGFTGTEVLGQNPRILASGKHGKEFYREMWEAIRNEGHWQGEIWDKAKDGHLYPKWMSISAVRSAEGEVTQYIAISSDMTERKRVEQEIEQLAFFDVLTGLPNRTLLRDRLEQMLVQSHRDEGVFALMFMDLDRFKYVNDSMGHSIGDKLLQAVAKRIQECVREGDTVARLGGDEFVVLLREADSMGASTVAAKLIKSIGEPFLIEGIQISTHASIGISLYPVDAQDSDTLVKNADVAMYRAKEDGRNNFQFFEPEMNFRANRIFGMERDLHNALEENQFELHYQPQADLTSGEVCGVEALIRWNHPDKGRISPADFIPVAEETGQIVRLGEWVLRAACKQLAEWRSRGMPVFPLAVNLSIRQLLQPSLVDLVREVLQENHLEPGDLELEITEGIMMGDAKAALEFLTRMHEMGVLLSIDDFGTGYSSLNYLKNLPVDKLKIDQSFVRDIETDSSDAAIVRSIISLGHRLDLRVIAEGVENLTELDFLRMRGCDEIQGYYFSQPLPAAEFERFIQAHPVLV